jgi:hypothetical protein
MHDLKGVDASRGWLGVALRITDSAVLHTSTPPTGAELKTSTM